MRKIGTIYDSIDDLLENKKTDILNNMPVLQDKNCLECPLIGYCWGFCTNASPLVKIIQANFVTKKAWR